MSDRSRDSPENRRFTSAEVRFLNDGQAKMAAIEEIRRWTGGKLGKKGSSGKNGSGMPQIVLEKQPGRAPSLESVTTEDRGRGVDGLAATTTQTALFTAASSRT
jgi:hypothetical protein